MPISLGVLGMGMPKTRGCPYHRDSGRVQSSNDVTQKIERATEQYSRH